MGHATLYVKTKKKRGANLPPKVKDNQKTLKVKYNALLKQVTRLMAYVDNEEIPLEKREERIPEFQKLCPWLNVLLDKIGSYSHEEATEGFTVE